MATIDERTAGPAAPAARLGVPRWRRGLILVGALLVYAGVVTEVVWSVHGVPAARDLLVPLLLGGFLAVSVTSVRRLRRLAVGVAVDWLPFVLMLWLYDLIRGYADGNWLPVHYGEQIRLDRLSGFGSVPTLWLQAHLWDGVSAIHWYDYATWVVYMSYFFGTTAVLAMLWWRSRALYWRFAANVVVLAFAGCATFVLFPADPPWLAAQEGHIGSVERLVGAIGSHVPVVTLQPLWETGTRYANDVAAVPSLHAAYTLLISLFLVRRLHGRWRHLLWLYPPAMAFALVYTGEHYVSDIVLGWLYCIVVYAAVEWAFGRLEARRAAAAPAPDREPEPEPAG
jgi:hypothetical protein